MKDLTWLIINKRENLTSLALQECFWPPFTCQESLWPSLTSIQEGGMTSLLERWNELTPSKKVFEYHPIKVERFDQPPKGTTRFD